MSENDFDSIRPYYDHEIPSALNRIANNPLFSNLMAYLFPADRHETLKTELKKAKKTNQFQRLFMLPVIRSIVTKTADDVIISGIEHVSKEVPCVFLANHRDIILDSAILNLMLVENGFDTSEIAWGDNLILSPFIEDIGKSNKMITVYREGTPKEMLKNSIRLSQYIRQSILERNQSVWIAQRKGRSKNGIDSTDPGVLKMLSLSGDESIVDSLSKLNITPVSISYEWEPCDAMKVRELYLSEEKEYVKEEHEDLRSIIGGVVTQKGRIHIHIGQRINNDLIKVDQNLRKNELLQEIANIIDARIQKNYKLWPTNYLAYDLLTGSKKHTDMYDNETKVILEKRLKHAQEITNGDPEKINLLLLKLYANPVVVG